MRGGPVRRRQVVVRFSDDELTLVVDRARQAGMAVGGWIGQVCVDAASGRLQGADLPDLLRLHADVVQVAGLPAVTDADRVVLDGLIRRLDAAVDAVVEEIERGRR